MHTAPLVHQGNVLVGNRGYGLFALGSTDGQLIWKLYFWGSWVESLPVVVGGTPYFVKHVASYTTLDRRTGKILTRRPLPDAGGYQWGISGSPRRSGDSIIVATIEGSLYAYPRR